MKRKLKRVITLVIIGFLAFFVCSWTLNRNYYFLFDDIAWLKVVKYNFDIKHFFTILPTSRYNDRPLRTFFIWVLYETFGLNYTEYYAVLIVMHIINAYMLLYVVKGILDRIGLTPSFETASVCALLFATYPKNLMAVYWFAGGANDLLCTTFILVSVLLYLRYMKDRQILFAILSLFMYILSMRTKEAAICYPLIVLFYEVYEVFINKVKFRIHSGYVMLIAYMFAYLIKYFSIPVNELTTQGQYEQKLSPLSILGVTANYIRMYFGLDDNSFIYRLGAYSTKIGNLGIVLVLLIFIYSFASLIGGIVKKKDLRVSLGIISLYLVTGFSLAPLLLLPNIQHLLYFYYVSIYLSMLFGCLIFKGIALFCSEKLKTIIPFATVGGLMLTCYFLPGTVLTRQNWLKYGSEANSAALDISSIQDIPAGYTCYIEGATDGVNIFNYGPGDCIAVLSDHDGVKCVLYNEGDEKNTPYVIWKYETGHVYELERVN